MGSLPVSRPLPRSIVLALATLLVTALLASSAPSASPEGAANEDQTRVGPAPGDLANVAHRGASGMAPENTLVAFSLALEQRANWIEFDLQLSADDEIVLLHDTDLSSSTNARELFPERAPWRVRDFTLEEIKQLDAGSHFNPRFAGEQVPTLREAIELIGHRAGVQLDVKSPHLYPGIEHRMIEELEAIPGYLDAALERGRVQVLAFDHDWLATFREVAPDGFVFVPMWGAGNIASRAELEEAAEYTNWMITAFDNVANNPQLRDNLHDLGFNFGLYTLNDASRMYDAVDLGAAAIATDYPSMLRALVESGLLDRDFEPPEDDRETITFQSAHYRIELTIAPSTGIERLAFDPDGQGQYREILNASLRGTIPFIGVGQFSPVAPVGEPAEVVQSPDGRDLTLRGIPMLGQPVTVDWEFRFEDEWFDHEMNWHVTGETSEPVYQVGWGLDTNLPRLGDSSILDRDRSHAVPFPDWTINWDDDLTVVAAYLNDSAWSDDDVFFSTANNFIAWTPLWESGGRDWPVGEYAGGRWRMGASGTGPDEQYATQLHAELNG